MIRSVKGVGYCTDPTLKATESKGVQYESYQKWVSMLTRVHDDVAEEIMTELGLWEKKDV